MQSMIGRILEQENAIRLVLSSDRKASHLVLSWQDIDVLQAINDALSPLAEFTDVMSGEDYVTVSAVLPIINLLKVSILKQNDSDKTLTNDLRSRILDDLLKRNTDPAVACLSELASFLDPRFKDKFMTDIDNMHDTVTTEAVTLLGEVDGSSATRTNSPILSASAPDCPPPAKKRLLGSLLKSKDTVVPELSGTIAHTAPEDKIKKEISMYLGNTTLDEEEDPLKWWRLHEPLYPMLAMVAKKFLCIPATSTSSERVFSKGGRISTSLRASLKPTTVEMLIFLSINL